MEHQSKTPKGMIAWFAQNPVAANLLMLGVIIVGLFSVNSLRKEAFPSLEPDIVTVSVNYDSGDPIQAEEGVSIKIEEALETVAGIKRITSTSSASGSHVSIEKETNYSLDTLLTDVKTKVDAINNLPAEADNPVIDKARMQDHALWVQLYGDADRSEAGLDGSLTPKSIKIEGLSSLRLRPPPSCTTGYWRQPKSSSFKYRI